MSQETVEIVRRVHEAFNARDLRTLLELVAPDIEWRPALFGGGIVEGPDRVLVEVHLVAVGRTSGVGVERTTWTVIQVRDGKVASEHAYLNEAEALEATAAFRSSSERAGRCRTSFRLRDSC